MVASKDHPRRCGENVPEPNHVYELPGSPPQVRGKLFEIEQGKVTFGITPAGAGKTINDAYAGQAQAGSPPQVRGKRALTAVAVGTVRITPAGAGKTLRDAFPIFAPQDHPRRCGENEIGKALSYNCLGSPPQVRGKLSSYSHNNNIIGITPAGAGKTFSPSSPSPKKRDHPRRCGEN